MPSLGLNEFLTMMGGIAAGSLQGKMEGEAQARAQQQQQLNDMMRMQQGLREQQQLGLSQQEFGLQKQRFAQQQQEYQTGLEHWGKEFDMQRLSHLGGLMGTGVFSPAQEAQIRASGIKQFYPEVTAGMAPAAAPGALPPAAPAPAPWHAPMAAPAPSPSPYDTTPVQTVLGPVQVPSLRPEEQQAALRNHQTRIQTVLGKAIQIDRTTLKPEQQQVLDQSLSALNQPTTRENYPQQAQALQSLDRLLQEAGPEVTKAREARVEKQREAKEKATRTTAEARQQMITQSNQLLNQIRQVPEGARAPLVRQYNALQRRLYGKDAPVVTPQMFHESPDAKERLDITFRQKQILEEDARLRETNARIDLIGKQAAALEKKTQAAPKGPKPPDFKVWMSVVDGKVKSAADEANRMGATKGKVASYMGLAEGYRKSGQQPPANVTALLNAWDKLQKAQAARAARAEDYQRRYQQAGAPGQPTGAQGQAGPQSGALTPDQIRGMSTGDLLGHLAKKYAGQR